MASTDRDADDKKGVLHLLLSLFAEVQPKEVFTVLILTLNVFLLLMAYYFLKVVREPLILAGGGGSKLDFDGPEVKAYTAAGQALLLVGLVRAYTALSKRFGRMQLSTILALFFGSNLVLFYFLALIEVPLGIAFYLWVGCFSLTVIAQFWSFANDVYTPEQGKRLFAIIGVGSSLGAAFGARLAKRLYLSLGPYNMMLAAAGVLMLCLGLTYLVHRWEIEHRQGAVAKADAPPGGSKGGFAMVLADRYLLLIAALMLLLNWVNTTGEYILDRTLIESATRTLAPVSAEPPPHTGSEHDSFKVGAPVYVIDLEASQIADGKITAVKADGELDVDAGGHVTTAKSSRTAFPHTEAGKKSALGAVIGAFKGDYFSTVNLVGLFLQLFIVSRLFKYFGVRVALFFLPCIALFGYSTLAFVPILSFVRVAKIAENSTDYSIQNTAKQALYLPVSREAKYNAKAAIDTVIARCGDMFSAGIVILGQVLSFTTQTFALVNLGLVLVWLAVVTGIAREHRKRTEGAQPEPALAKAA